MHAVSATVTLVLVMLLSRSSLDAQEVLFDFDNAPLHSGLPLDQIAGGITARLSATGQGYSIQEANVLGFTPQGFAGRIIYPNSISLADLLIHFDQSLTDFSIMYSCQELGCDDAATMRVTAYLNGKTVGTSTKTAGNPGTWPVDTLRCSFPVGFDSVVVHYDSPPPTCRDYGTIFMADNMRVTRSNVNALSEDGPPGSFTLSQNYPNPFNPFTTIRFGLPRTANVNLVIDDILGRRVAVLVNETMGAGSFDVKFDGTGLSSGVYFYRIQVRPLDSKDGSGGFAETKRLCLVR